MPDQITEKSQHWLFFSNLGWFLAEKRQQFLLETENCQHFALTKIHYSLFFQYVMKSHL